MSFPWQRYEGTYTSGWDNPAKKKAAAKKAKAVKKTPKPRKKRGAT